ncbi:MAG: carbohydrate ABC transporter substrate-binding protein [Hydrogenibacillus sp.]|nr:carbohydrate ABC transporter substrate-binding protein [Hydrogenibacillus sp.]
MRKRARVWIWVFALVVTLSACSSGGSGNTPGNTAGEDAAQKGGASDAPAQAIKITLLNSKGEIQELFETAAQTFHEAHPDIELSVVPAAIGQSPYEKLTSMINAGNAPTIAMLDTSDVLKFADQALDLRNEQWVNDALPWTLDAAKTGDGRLIGFPFAVEGYGLMYNRAVIEKALGASWDPAALATRADLAALFEKLKAKGQAPILLSPMDWSLGAHFLPISYAVQGKTHEDVGAFLAALKKGEVDLASNAGFNGLMDTFELLKQYNVNQDDPLSGTYDEGVAAIGDGQAAFWFMGNWAWQQIKDFATDDGFGFVPVFISDNPEDYGNREITVGATKYLIVDRAQSTPEEQEAARAFLNWLVYDEAGQNMLVKEMGIIPAFSNIEQKPDDPLARSVLSYMNEGHTLQFMTTLPADHWNVLGAEMQKMLAGKLDRKGLAQAIEAYWREQAK